MRTGRLDETGCLLEVLPERDALPGRYHPEFIGSLIEIPGDVAVGWYCVDGEWRDRLPPGPISADDIRAEASRRLQRLLGARDGAHLDIIIANGTREAVRLLRLAAERPWTDYEAQRAAELQQVDAAIEAIRAASNAMEADPPKDYTSSLRWPSI
jgi:hypothetical protein